jgi:hypothetical protein
MLLFYSLLLGLCLNFICVSGTTFHNFSQYSFLCDVQFDPKYVNLLGWVCLDDTPLTTPCSWSGVKCDDGDQIISLQLTSVGLSGSIPNAIMKLTALTSLSIDSNLLTGSIPESVGNMTSLRFLNASNNCLAGSIALTELERLYLFSNSLTGSVLNVHHNQLSYMISDGIGNWVNFISVFDIHENQLSATVRDEFKNWINLNILDLPRNVIGGSIPCTFKKLRDLKVSDLLYNYVEGAIENLNSTSSLISIQLRNNILGGSIPFMINSFVDLVSLDIRGNKCVDNYYLLETIFWRIGYYYCSTNLRLNDIFLTGSIQNNIKEIEMWNICICNFNTDNYEYYDPNRKEDIINHCDISFITSIRMQVAASYTTTNGSSHSSLYNSVHLFMWWLTLLGITTSKIFSRLFTIPAINQRHMNAVFRNVMFCVIIIFIFKIPVGVNGAFSRSSKLLANDGAGGDRFGTFVSIYGTTAMIGAYADDDKATNAGILMIYSRICIC